MINDHKIYALNECPTDEIAAYIDGELDVSRELDLDVHFSECRICSFELNQQKQLICGLNTSLKVDEDFELPSNFVKTIVANAESTVSGVRRPRELYNAIFICVGLFLFVLFVLGGEAGLVVANISNVLSQMTVVGGVFWHLIYSISLGVIIVLRSIAAQLQFQSDLIIFIALASVFSALLIFVSLKIVGIRRA